MIVAIDPGITGAIAFLPDDPGHVAVYDMPAIGSEVNAAELSQLLEQFRPAIAFVEHVGPMPRDGVRQAWRFSAAYTTARVVLAMLHVPTMLITPAVWKKAMHVSGNKKGKEQCRAMAVRLFPACASSFARKKDAGRAEAALLAHYARALLAEAKTAA
jgi:Holliday junction resolvasome RuvABC endonuclease subunit